MIANADLTGSEPQASVPLERMGIINRLADQDWVYVVDAIEAKLKEKNT